ncbi:hypothetical protein VNO80_24347 [Phaseolus coccineus]|uniref:Uncharacterized protein n=1 Tax=Phaseolus coccineus TaxID=3886 RepID=A0AAN9QS94_PHACN
MDLYPCGRFLKHIIKTLTLVGRTATAFSTLCTCLGGVWVTTAHTLTLKYPKCPSTLKSLRIHTVLFRTESHGLFLRSD